MKMREIKIVKKAEVASSHSGPDGAAKTKQLRGSSNAPFIPYRFVITLLSATASFNLAATTRVESPLRKGSRGVGFEADGVATRAGGGHSFLS
ncbi:hypothetical protein CCM_00563 [Cordyceps militaris CM01]|uniref:Uncharacterized protein n=1 Tax=Cordyceps militaris (strain CM01) TaxID=983644 RepID=G3J4U2_CORMM|nr:uncharacterized protein CCM_00563 [Cordyceps militaris CM01]EGX95909.1 hypothetical protein CCM_00563 [Cordyceps militaris CM01]